MDRVEHLTEVIGGRHQHAGHLARQAEHPNAVLGVGLRLGTREQVDGISFCLLLFLFCVFFKASDRRLMVGVGDRGSAFEQQRSKRGKRSRRRVMGTRARRGTMPARRFTRGGVRWRARVVGHTRQVFFPFRVTLFFLFFCPKQRRGKSADLFSCHLVARIY